MRPSHRLDLVLVPVALDAPIARAHRLVDRLREAGVIGVSGEPGPNAAFWAASFSRVRIEESGRIVLWSNGTGGFRVGCPITGASVRAAFEAALTAWRAAQTEDVSSFACPACGSHHALAEVHAAPPIAFGRWGLVTAGVDGPDLARPGRSWADEILGPTTAVWRRGG